MADRDPKNPFDSEAFAESTETKAQRGRQKPGEPADGEQPLGPLVTVFVLNWNRKADLLEALASVRRQTYRPIEMLVVDNGSKDGSAEAVEGEYPEARLVRLNRNYGCPGGRNRGIAEARGEFIFFLDNDGVLHERAIEHAVKRILAHPRIAVVSAKTVYYQTGEESFLFGKEATKINQPFFSNRFSGGASLHRAAVYGEVGIYPDDYMYGGEEADLALRLLDHGYFIQYAPEVIMYHKVLNTARDRSREFLHLCCNALTTAWRLWPIELAVAYTLTGSLAQGRRAWRQGWLQPWLTDSPRRCGRIFKAIRERRPVRRSTMVYRLRLNGSYPDSPLPYPEKVSLTDYLKAIIRSRSG
ncbi:MAG: glycosyltransferase family 2 protein [Deltaproteobacteria bacterium]|nr:glycosyltransferase family 2 protein [Deltaproteobacteria bacterium]